MALIQRSIRPNSSDPVRCHRPASSSPRVIYPFSSPRANGAKDLSFFTYHLLRTERPQLRIRCTHAMSSLAYKEMDRFSAPARLMIVSDLDHTMVDHHDPENTSLLRFNAMWESIYRHNSLLVFSTGRSPTLYKQLRKEKPLLTPDITIMSVGTEITYGDSMVPDEGWEVVLNKAWNRNIALEEAGKFPQLKLQPETEQRPHKVSFYVDKGHAQEVLKSLPGIFKSRGLDVKIIYSGGIDLDILPQGAGKGEALSYLLKKFKEAGKLPLNTLACGDSGNDAELFSISDVYGVMVSNAQEELLQWHAENAKGNSKIIHATERCAAGIIEAIAHFGLGPNISPRDSLDLLSYKPEDINPAIILVTLYIAYERWRQAAAENYESFIQSLKTICHPSGTIIHPSGVEQPLHEWIDTLRPYYGDKQGKKFLVWVDRAFTSKIGSDTLLVKFDKWELTDEGRNGCVTTFVLNSKPDSPGSFSLVHIHQTWLEGFAASTDDAWIF
ncbi:sucrose-phosphatase 2-like isoform X1 [Zingiber officinale]|uniref:sucrose-phosphatase 2-like isoform X1 n=1 Tax=Zingiber officinale TaxID=94328 RepID=UPI001C4C5C0C|nr:sucrose-phosphatase 2-like isoform X1 [Zingiber officinale]